MAAEPIVVNGAYGISVVQLASDQHRPGEVLVGNVHISLGSRRWQISESTAYELAATLERWWRSHVRHNVDRTYTGCLCTVTERNQQRSCIIEIKASNKRMTMRAPAAATLAKVLRDWQRELNERYGGAA